MEVEVRREELRQKTLSSLLWKVLERGGVPAGGLLVQVVMARLLSPEDFGALAIMLVFVLLGTVFAVSGFNTALVQVKKLEEADYDTVFWISVIVGTLLWGVLIIAAPWIAGAFALPAMTNPLRMMGALFVLNSVYAVLTADVQRHLAFKKVFKASVVSLVVASAVGIGAAVWGAGLWALVIHQLTNVAVNSVMLFLQTAWRPRLRFSIVRARVLFGFSWKLLVSALLDVSYQSLSDVIIGRQFSAASLGVVSQGKKYPGAVAQVLDGAIQPVMLSAVARVQDDLTTVKSLVRRALKTSTLVVVPLMTLLAVTADPLVRWGLGEKWAGAVIFFQMYCFIYALWPVHTTNLSALNGMGRSDLFLKLEIVKKIVGLTVLCVTVFGFHSPIAIVAGFMVTGIIGTVINAFPNRTVIGYRYAEQVRDMAPVWGLSLLSGAISGGVMSSVGGTYQEQIVIGFAVFGSVFLSVGLAFRCEALTYVTDRGVKFLRGRSLCRQA